MNFKSQNNEISNKDFNLDELVEAFQLSHDSATGPDENHYQMLKHLPDTSLETLLNIFNYIWTTGKFQDDWYMQQLFLFPKKVSEYDQEIPQSQTADNPVAPRGRATQPSRDTRKTN